MIMGEDDKHLNFRVSLLLETKENDLATGRSPLRLLLCLTTGPAGFIFCPLSLFTG